LAATSSATANTDTAAVPDPSIKESIEEKYGGTTFVFLDGSSSTIYPPDLVIRTDIVGGKTFLYKEDIIGTGTYIIEENDNQALLKITNGRTLIMDKAAPNKGFVLQSSDPQPVAANAQASSNSTSPGKNATAPPVPATAPASAPEKKAPKSPSPPAPAPAPPAPVPAPAAAPVPDTKQQIPFATESDHETKGKLPKPEGYKCGSMNGNTHCPDGMCCGPNGICGTGPAFCKHGACENGFGHCEGTMDAKDMAGRCGMPFGGQKCAEGECCSAFSWCGTGDAFCTAKQD
jgi:chitinase